MIRADFDELDISEDEGGGYLYQLAGKPFTGIAYERSLDGALVSEVPFENGFQAGIARDWYPSGQLAVEENYWNGARHGLAVQWHPNGRLKSEAQYEYSILVKEETWDIAGRAESKFEMQRSDPLYCILELWRERYGPSLTRNKA